MWGNCAQTKINRIFILQKYIIRILCNLKIRNSCRDAFKQLDIVTFPSLYIYETIVFCLDKCSLVQGNDIHSHDTRSVTSYRIDYHRLELFKKLPSQAGIILFQKLPKKVQNLHNTKLIKNELTNYLVSNSFYSVQEFLEHSLTT